MADNKPIYETRKFQYLIIGSIAAPVIIIGVKSLISGWFEKKKMNRTHKNAIAEENNKSQRRKEEVILKSERRLKEEVLRHKNEMEFEDFRHRNKMEEIGIKNCAEPKLSEIEVEEEYVILPSVNVGQLVNTPIPEHMRIKYLSNTYLQNQDIMLMYGPPGIGKSHEVVDLVSEITTHTSPRKNIPLSNNIELPFTCFYYDKEPKNTEWNEKFNGRTDLNNIERIPCREINASQLLIDIKARIAQTRDTNIIIVIDPITNFDIKGDAMIHDFINKMTNIQDNELKLGRNIVFLLIAHAVKTPKDKPLSDLGGSKVWSESVQTVVSLMPVGPQDCYRKLTFDKTKNGKEVTRGTSFIMCPVNTPHYHLNYSEELTNEYRNFGTVKRLTIESEEPVIQKPKRTGKLANVTTEDASRMLKMHEEDGISFKAIAKDIGKKYNLYPAEVRRLIKDLKSARA